MTAVCNGRNTCTQLGDSGQINGGAKYRARFGIFMGIRLGMRWRVKPRGYEGTFSGGRPQDQPQFLAVLLHPALMPLWAIGTPVEALLGLDDLVSEATVRKTRVA